MKKIFLAIFTMFLFVAGYAENKAENSDADTNKDAVQNVEFTGSIIDVISSEALVGVEVQIEGTDMKTYTDFDGNFRFENLKPGKYDIVASYISYEKNTLKGVEVTQASDNIKIKLEISK